MLIGFKLAAVFAGWALPSTQMLLTFVVDVSLGGGMCS